MENSKLTEFIQEIKRSVNKGLDYDIFNLQILMQYLKNNPDVLKQFDEFKNVKKINFVDTPIFAADHKTEEPVAADENYLGGPTKPILVETVLLSDSTDLLNEVVDLYSIDSVSFYNPDFAKDLPCGVWQHPTKYNPINFAPNRKIEVIFSLDSIAGERGITKEEAKAQAKKIILKQVSDLIDSEETNVFVPKRIIVRCSPRSIKKQDN